jgi:hypothetical protein
MDVGMHFASERDGPLLALFLSTGHIGCLDAAPVDPAASALEERDFEPGAAPNIVGDTLH